MSDRPFDVCVCPIVGPHLPECAFSWEDDLAGFGFSVSSVGWSRFCDHAQERVILWDGTEVFASAHFDRAARTFEPDLAVWLADSWRTDVPSLVIDWPDYGLPNLSDDHFLYVANLALREAREGRTVETGCIGGHGRTGTMLACLDVIASGPDANAKDSIAYIRRDYCSKAIETKEQEWFVAKIAAIVTGTKIPPKPYIPKPKPQPAPRTNVVTIDGGTGKKITSKRSDGKTFTYWKGKK